MSDIMRFSLYTGGMGESKTGMWVEYEEHLAIVRKLVEEINLLKMQEGVMYQNGWVDGYNKSRGF